MTRGKKTALILAVVILAAVVGCAVYVNDYYAADSEALAALADTEWVTVVQQEDLTAFCPENAEAGLIFYPGGSMAASYAAEQAQALEGLILLAAYSTADLTETGLEVLSLYGTEDGVLNRQKYESSRVNLPEGFREVIIEGGNHAQFGSYGPQEGDGTAAITQTAQIRQTADAIAAWMQEMGS